MDVELLQFRAEVAVAAGELFGEFGLHGGLLVVEQLHQVGEVGKRLHEGVGSEVSRATSRGAGEGIFRSRSSSEKWCAILDLNQ